MPSILVDVPTDCDVWLSLFYKMAYPVAADVSAEHRGILDTLWRYVSDEDVAGCFIQAL